MTTRVDWQWHRERSKVPAAITKIVVGEYASVIARDDEKHIRTGTIMVPEGWWASQCRSKS